MLLKVVSFLLLLGSAMSQQQTPSDVGSCYFTAENEVNVCIKQYPFGNIQYYSNFRFQLYRSADCSNKARFYDLKMCILNARRKCISDERWFSMEPTSGQFDDAFDNFCQRPLGSYSHACYDDRRTEYSECVKREATSRNVIKTDFYEQPTFEAYKEQWCKQLDVYEACAAQTKCNDTRKRNEIVITQVWLDLRPTGCGPSLVDGPTASLVSGNGGISSLTYNLVLLLFSYILVKL